MTDDLRSSILAIIDDVAPDADTSGLSSDDDFREALGIDSMDFLGILERIASEHGVEVPEADYDAVSTLGSLEAYVQSRR